MKLVATLICLLSISSSLFANETENMELGKLYEKIVGLPSRSFVSSVENPEGLSFDEKFNLIYFNKNFVENRLANLVSRLSDESDNPFLNVDDFQVSLVLAMMEGNDFRKIFTDDYHITNSDNEVVRPAILNDAGFDVLYRKYEEHSLVYSNPENGSYFSGYYEGIFTTVGFGSRFLSDGTNRRPIRAIYDIFLCTKLEAYKDSGLSSHFVGPDIDRSPGDSFEVFEQRCSSCHAPIDAQRGSFAYQDYVDDRTVLLNEVAEKYNRNSREYGGYMTYDNSWTNPLVSEYYQEMFGWRTEVNGQGLSSYSNMIVSSEKFSECMVQKATQEICGLTEEELAGTEKQIEINKTARQFEEKSYVYKELVKEIVRNPLLCPN